MEISVVFFLSPEPAFGVDSVEEIQAAVRKLAQLTETEHRLVAAEALTETKRAGSIMYDVSVIVTTTNFTVSGTGRKVGQVHLHL